MSTLRSVGNPTDSYRPFPDVTMTGPIAPSMSRFVGLGGQFNGWPVPSGEPGNLLRTGERYYWYEGDIPSPPPMDDPRWKDVRLYLLNTINRGQRQDHRAETFIRDVFTDAHEDERPEDGTSRGKVGNGYGLSAGHTARFFREHYSNAACDNTPVHRGLGWEPGGDGIPAGNHYSSAMWHLENFMLYGDPKAWQRFVHIVLHLAGQGWDTKYGACLYEKSSSIYPGVYYQRGFLQWSHMWYDALIFFHHLTGDMGDVVQELYTYGLNNPQFSNEYWGIRRITRYLRTLRAADLCLPDVVVADDHLAWSIIDDALREVESYTDEPWFHNKGAPGNIDVWQDWDFLAESMAFAIQKGRADELYPRLKPIADFHIANHLRPDGLSAYYQSPSGQVHYKDFSGSGHTSMALPYMAAMVQRGDLEQSVLKRSWDAVMERLPYDDQIVRVVAGRPRLGRGVLWKSPSKATGERPWGGMCLKVANLAHYWTRGDVEKIALR